MLALRAFGKPNASFVVPVNCEFSDNCFKFLIGGRFVGVCSPLGHYVGICGHRYVGKRSFVLLVALLAFAVTATLAPALALLAVTLARAVAVLLAVAATLASPLLVLPSALLLAGSLAVAAISAPALAFLAATLARAAACCVFALIGLHLKCLNWSESLTRAYQLKCLGWSAPAR